MVFWCTYRFNIELKPHKAGLLQFYFVYALVLLFYCAFWFLWSFCSLWLFLQSLDIEHFSDQISWQKLTLSNVVFVSNFLKAIHEWFMVFYIFKLFPKFINNLDFSSDFFFHETESSFEFHHFLFIFLFYNLFFF